MKITSAPFGCNASDPTSAHTYVLPPVIRRIQKLFKGTPVTILDIGCGNAYVASQLVRLGHRVLAFDSSPDGIDIARKAYPSVKFHCCDIYDDGFEYAAGDHLDCVISLEVVEHLFYPKGLFERSYQVLRDGGYLIVSTPYHGYLKNLAISLVNGWDRHFNVEWDGGHIKFFSKKTLARVACGAGFKNPSFYGVGRLPWLWKSMIMLSEK